MKNTLLYGLFRGRAQGIGPEISGKTPVQPSRNLGKETEFLIPGSRLLAHDSLHSPGHPDVAPKTDSRSLPTNTFFLPILLFLTGMLIAQTDYESQRRNMVSKQLKKRDITDRATLNAMTIVPRHEFVPDDMKGLAYEDGPLPIGEGQTISQPYIVGFMTQALDLKPEYKVLEIGTGSGYQAAILGEIVDSVFTIEIVEKLGRAARTKLAEMNYANIKVKIGDGYHGWPEKSPFDAIIVTAGAEKIPPKLIEQLKEGGRLIIPVGPSNGVEQLVLMTKKNGKVKTKELMPVRFVPFTREKRE